jgi:hypothetical protein
MGEVTYFTQVMVFGNGLTKTCLGLKMNGSILQISLIPDRALQK